MKLVRLRAPGGLENLKLVEENPPKPREIGLASDQSAHEHVTSQRPFLGDVVLAFFG